MHTPHFPLILVLDGWNQVEKQLFVNKQVKKQIDKTALSINKFKKKRFNFLYIVGTVWVWDSYRLKCDKCDITIITCVLLSSFGEYWKVWYILKFDDPTKYKNDNLIPRSKELYPGHFFSLGVIYTSVLIYLWYILHVRCIYRIFCGGKRGLTNITSVAQ